MSGHWLLSWFWHYPTDFSSFLAILFSVLSCLLLRPALSFFFLPLCPLSMFPFLYWGIAAFLQGLHHDVPCSTSASLQQTIALFTDEYMHTVCMNVYDKFLNIYNKNKLIINSKIGWKHFCIQPCYIYLFTMCPIQPFNVLSIPLLCKTVIGWTVMVGTFYDKITITTHVMNNRLIHGDHKVRFLK